ncbi:MAG: alpha-L-fucosidase [Bacteroidetes bacterium]|nr:alpha-L-fucosidase [Bacteroidota bacterium]
MRPFFLLFFIPVLAFAQAAPPAPVYPITEPRQLAWQELQYYGFVHFNMNTFSDREWGFGDEQPSQFAPTALDARQWARVAKEAGMKGLIITAKHHDGFVLWPSAYTEHSVKNSPWRNGKGDLIREFVDACWGYGLKVGIYYSPWDRNHSDYGKPEYITYMRNQLTELLSNYGELFEVWFDGANGGSGWYGGANEERVVDKLTYYDWPSMHALVRELQPGAMLFSDAGPDVRWVGNEHGFAYPTTWSNLMRDSVYAGMPEYSDKWAMGQLNGTHWVPAEADVSIRPGWYYHAYEDHKLKTLPELLEIYYQSIGQNSSLLINFPVDTRGLIPDSDVQAIRELAAKVKEDFALNLATGAKISASASRGAGYAASQVLDGNYDSYWSSAAGERSASLELDFGKPKSFNRILIQEYVNLGQRVSAFTVEKQVEGKWLPLAQGTTIGYTRILRVRDTQAQKIRINFLEAKGEPLIAELGVFAAPALVFPPKITRSTAGLVSIAAADPGLDIYYTVDGSVPLVGENRYDKPFLLEQPATVQAIVVDAKTGKSSAIRRQELDLVKGNWKVLSTDSKAQAAIDELPHTYWTSPTNALKLDLGEKVALLGLRYLPMQARYPSGFIADYVLEGSLDGSTWVLLAKGEFANIQNNPIEQVIRFAPQELRYVRLKALRTVDGNAATFGELGAITR